MIVVDKLLVSGIGWVLRRVADAVHCELYDESSLREELLAEGRPPAAWTPAR